MAHTARATLFSPLAAGTSAPQARKQHGRSGYSKLARQPAHQHDRGSRAGAPLVPFPRSPTAPEAWSKASHVLHAQSVEKEVAIDKKLGTTDSPYTVLITGSTKGIGRALAVEFLRLGDNVVITSRDAARVTETVKELSTEFGADRVTGLACNVAKGADVAALADTAVSRFGKVDIWINNAGTNAYYYGPLADSNDSDLASIVETNVLGVMLCCREAIRVMKEQPGGGHIFNMDGAGADGNPTPRFAAYGATKRGLQQFSKSLQAELKMQGSSKVVVHNLSPGMVTTELLMSGANTPQAKWFINALAEPANDVATFLVPRVRQVLKTSNGSPAQPTYIQFLTKPKAFSQIFGRALFGLRKNRWVKED